MKLCFVRHVRLYSLTRTRTYTHTYTQGMWRKVFIDDFIPVDLEGRVLLPQSSLPRELWPMLLTKAICKVMSAVVSPSDNGAELVSESALVAMLTGWCPESIPVHPTM